MFTLQQQVDETKTESEYQLRLKDNKYAEEARILKKKFNADISDLKQVSMGFFLVKSISRKNLHEINFTEKSSTQNYSIFVIIF